MADYRKMYYRMVDASERVLELLEQRQTETREPVLLQQVADILRQGELDCEELYLDEK